MMPKVLYIEDNEALPAHIVQLDADAPPGGYTLSFLDSDWAPADRPPILFRFVEGNGELHHEQINYRSGLQKRLHRYVNFGDSSMWFRGEYRRVEYYTDTQRTELVLKVVVEYKRQTSGLLTRVSPAAVWGDADYFGRRSTRTWYREDGTAHPTTKVTHKTYDLADAAAEGERRRTNVKRRMKLDVLQMLVATTAADPFAPTKGELDFAQVTGMTYMAKYRNQLTDYVETGDLSFTGAGSSPNIAADTEPWLDSDLGILGLPGVTIRDSILGSLKEILAP